MPAFGQAAGAALLRWPGTRSTSRRHCCALALSCVTAVTVLKADHEVTWVAAYSNPESLLWYGFLGSLGFV